MTNCEKIMLMTIWTIFILIATTLFSNLYGKTDEEYFLRMLKEDAVEKKLMNSEVLKDCISVGKNASREISAKITATSKCMEEKIAGLDKSKVESLIKGLELGKTELYGDPNQKNLAKFISELVEKSLYGEAHKNPGALNNLDQEMFTLVYERVVGKALFFEMADYCLQRDDTKKISDIVVKYKDQATTEIKVNECVETIRKGCEFKATTATDVEAAACLFNRRLLEYRAIMAKLKEDKEFWAEVRKNSETTFRVENLDTSKLRSVGEIATDLTKISSSKLVGQGYLEDQAVLSNQAKEMKEKCVDKPSDESCKKFFNRGIGDSLGQYRLQKELLLDLKIKSLNDADLSTLKETAKESNYFSKKKLEELLIGSESDLKKAITEKYQAEKLAIQVDIDKKIKDIGVSNDESLADASTKIKNIHKILEDRPEELRAVNFFSNIIIATFNFENDNIGAKRVLSGIDEEIKDLKAKTDDPETKDAISYLEGLKKGRTTASTDENHFLKPEEIDNLLYPKD